MSKQPHFENPYMGGEVEQFKMSNGAYLNKRIADFYSKRVERNINQLCEGITVLEGYSLENTVIINGNNSVLVWDTGQNSGIGKEKYQALRQLTKKPISAIIYSHHHYVRGAKAFLQDQEEKNVLVIGHPDLHENLMTSSLYMGPILRRNLAQHFGMYLPNEGKDAPPVSFEGNEDSDKSSGYIKPTLTVKDGEEIEIDGVSMQFFYSPSDTNDSLSLWLPEYETVITNSILGSFPNIYTLRGQPYRDPVKWIEGIDKIRRKKTKYVIPSHGKPTTNYKDSDHLLTDYRDAIAFTYYQTVRGINKGLRPEEIAESIQLPNHLAKNHRLAEVYGEYKHHIKGIYNGLIGWFSMDASDMNPVTNEYRAKQLIAGFGGEEKIIQSAIDAIDHKKYAWAAELINHILTLDFTHVQARKIKAEALRKMGQVSPALSSRNFYLTQALQLENKIDLYQIPEGFPKSFNESEIEIMDFSYFVKVLESKIKGELAEHINLMLAIKIQGDDEAYGIHIRQGVAEFIGGIPEQYDLSIKTSKLTWIQILSGKLTVESALLQNKIITNGKKEKVIETFQLFDLNL